MKKKNKKGFSLVEMLVVVAIIGILSTVLYTSYTKYVTQSKKAVAKAEALEIMEVFQTAMVDHQTAYKGDEVEIDNYTTFEELVTLDMKEAYLDATGIELPDTLSLSYEPVGKCIIYENNGVKVSYSPSNNNVLAVELV